MKSAVECNLLNSIQTDRMLTPRSVQSYHPLEAMNTLLKRHNRGDDPFLRGEIQSKRVLFGKDTTP